MGLFGRDDSQAPKPAANAPAPSRSQTAPQPSAETTIIARSCRVEGNLSGSGDVNIQGHFQGEIDGSGQLLIAEGGTAEARLHARTIVVAGTVKGDVSAAEKIELKPTANLLGNITAPRILIQEGATFEGQVFMKKPASPSSETTDKRGGKSDRAEERAGKNDKAGKNDRDKNGKKV